MELLLQLQPNYIKKKKTIHKCKKCHCHYFEIFRIQCKSKVKNKRDMLLFFYFFLRDFNEQYAEGLYAEGPKNSVIDNWTVKVLILMQSEKKINKP